MPSTGGSVVGSLNDENRRALLEHIGIEARYRTYRGMSFLANNEGTFDDGSARVVDAIQHRLAFKSVVFLPQLIYSTNEGSYL
jgi:hypothetical protein